MNALKAWSMTNNWEVIVPSRRESIIKMTVFPDETRVVPSSVKRITSTAGTSHIRNGKEYYIIGKGISISLNPAVTTYISAEADNAISVNLHFVD